MSEVQSIKINHWTRAKHKLRRLVAQSAPDYGKGALTVQAAQALTNRNDPSDLLPYIDFQDNYIVRDDGERPQLGFGYHISPVFVAGKDIEQQLESLISNCPDDSVIQFAAHSTPSIEDRINVWASRRLKYNKNPVMEQLVLRRARRFMEVATGESALPGERLHPREVNYYVFFTLTFRGDPEHEQEIKRWKMEVDEFRNSMEGTLQSLGFNPSLLSEFSTKKLLAELCNPQMKPADLAETLTNDGLVSSVENIKEAVFHKKTRLRVETNGSINFSDTEKNIAVVPITVDQYPSTLRLFQTGELIGKYDSRTDRIAAPYWLYTIIYKPNPEKAHDNITRNMGWISQQCMSESEWYKNMMPHLFKRRDDTSKMMEQLRSKYSATHVWTGINVMTTPERAISDADYVVNMWKRPGFKASRETNISLPVWVSSLPWGYNPRIDTAKQGLQRASLVTSMNAATMAICQGDWGGNGPVMRTDPKGESYPYANGLLLMSRRGQLACIDIYDSPTNYNFAIIAESGAGKSFFANEIIADLLGRDGLVRVIDVGASYRDLCEIVGGTEIIFNPEKPVSLNPFWGMSNGQKFSDDESGTELGEMIPILKDVLTQMAFPRSDPRDYLYQMIEKAIVEKHKEYGLVLETKHIWEWFIEEGSEEGKEIALQLEPYAIGRHAAWFNGKPQLDLSNQFTVLELEELNSDLELREVVMTLLLAQTTRDMYLQSRSMPKLMLVDEAWDLFGAPKGGRFIETAFRRIRKYYGAAGFITQSFKDTDISPSATAAFDNSAWKFVLSQRGVSLKDAQENLKLGSDDDEFFNFLGGVKSGQGYSEIYVDHQSGSGLFRLVTDPYTIFLNSSKATDLTRINNLKEQGYSTHEAIEMLVDGKG